VSNLKSLTLSPDRLGIWASMLCVVHCIATPFLLSFSSVFAHFLPGEERTHRVLAMLIAVIGAVAIVRGSRIHGRWRILFLMAAGLVCIFTGAYVGDRLPSHNVEVAITLFGSCLMIASHRLNHTFCRRCTSCT
jgi:uncharacterized membrane protein YfcA